MKLYLSKITRLVGGSLQLDFGNIIKCIFTNSTGKTREIERGEYRLQFFDCSWRVVKDNKILFGCFDYDNEDEVNSIDDIPCRDIELIKLNSVNIFDLQLILSHSISIDVFAVSKSVSVPIYYFTNKNNDEIDIMTVIESELPKN